MSDRQIAKNRFHRGVSSYLRRYLRRAGLSLDEEMAQFALGGVKVFTGIPDDVMSQAVDRALTNRFNLMTQWEAENPGKNPFPPSFPERILKLAREALQQEYDDDGSPVALLQLIIQKCLNELETEPITSEGSEERGD